MNLISEASCYFRYITLPIRIIRFFTAFSFQIMLLCPQAFSDHFYFSAGKGRMYTEGCYLVGYFLFFRVSGVKNSLTFNYI